MMRFGIFGKVNQRVGVGAIEEMKGEDRISSLPDCLLVEIISRLPETKYAIRTGTLSKRWQHLWNQQIYNLIIHIRPSSTYDIPEYNAYNIPQYSTYDIPQFYSSLETILSQSNNLNRFKLHALYTYETKSQVDNCIRNAIDHNVHEVDLYMTLVPPDHPGFLLPEFFFVSSSFIRLTLYNCEFTQAAVVSLGNLRTLHIENTELDQVSITNVLSGCPVLETFILRHCIGFEMLDITNKSVKNLVFSGHGGPYYIDYVEINAPYILSLTIQDSLPVEKLVLLNVSSVIEVEFAYYQMYCADGVKLNDEMNEEILIDLLLSLGHVKEVKISESILQTLDGLKAKGFTHTWNLKVLGESN